VPSGDDSELAAALIRLFSLPESSRRAIGERGRVWVSAHFDAASVSEQTLALYADLLRPKPRSGPASPTENAAVRR
jgi:glycosyltransferase involved in cell wall biosynthesis